ncbi:MAG: YlxR family protein [Clostridia bacterium]|nr:YlxR family protein [Clostridia bacterium]
MCVSCRQMFDRRELLRVVKSPDGVVSVDVTGKKNGRGAYICSNPKCIDKSAKGLLGKHLGCEIPPQIYEEIRSTYGDKKQS